MDLLGHSQIGLTMNTYSHVIPDLRRDAAQRMQDPLQERSDSQLPRLPQLIAVSLR